MELFGSESRLKEAITAITGALELNYSQKNLIARIAIERVQAKSTFDPKVIAEILARIFGR